MKIRLAERHDCKDLWKWRNEPRTIANSYSKSSVSYPQHLRWFTNIIKDPKSTIFIGYSTKAKVKVGMIRFDKKDHNVTEVSINMAAQFRGKGLGADLLGKAVAKISSSKVNHRLKARVIVTNNNSKKFFKKCGFFESSIKNKTVYFSYHINEEDISTKMKIRDMRDN